MDELALDRELDKFADQALEKVGGNPENATVLLLHWIGQGHLRGLAERTLRDYVAATVAERARLITS